MESAEIRKVLCERSGVFECYSYPLSEHGVCGGTGITCKCDRRMRVLERIKGSCRMDQEGRRTRRRNERGDWIVPS